MEDTHPEAALSVKLCELHTTLHELHYFEVLKFTVILMMQAN